MKIVLLGKNGQLGWEFERSLPALGNVVALDREELDLFDLHEVQRILSELKPDVIVNASAYTDVDRAEREPELAMKVNALAPGVMAEVSRSLGAVLVHFSTDYVFDGNASRPAPNLFDKEKKMQRFKLCFFLLSAIALTVCIPLSAATVIQMNLEEMVGRADLIFRGTVLDARDAPALAHFYARLLDWQVFGEDEDRPGAAQRVTVLGYELWRTHFGRDSSVLGRTIAVDGARTSRGRT